MSNKDFDKEFFQRSWGPEGYYEEFTYGVGFAEVVQKCLVPFFNSAHTAVEIGSGGGTFTKKMINRFSYLTAIDVIAKPEQFNKYSADKFWYIELPDQTYKTLQPPNSVDFVFSYNCFCHLSNDALKQYLSSVLHCLKPGGNFVFMLGNHENNPQPECEGYSLGEMLPFGHFYQDHRTLPLILGSGWEVVNDSMIPEHRDIIVHLKKK